MEQRDDLEASIESTSGGSGVEVSGGGEVTGGVGRMTVDDEGHPPSSSSSSSSSEHCPGSAGRTVDSASASNANDMTTTTSAADADATTHNTPSPIAMLHWDDNNNNSNSNNRCILFTKLISFPEAVGFNGDPSVDSKHKFLCPITDFRSVLLDVMIGVTQMVRTLQQENVAGIVVYYAIPYKY